MEEIIIKGKKFKRTRLFPETWVYIGDPNLAPKSNSTNYVIQHRPNSSLRSIVLESVKTNANKYGFNFKDSKDIPHPFSMATDWYIHLFTAKKYGGRCGGRNTITLYIGDIEEGTISIMFHDIWFTKSDMLWLKYCLTGINYIDKVNENKQLIFSINDIDNILIAIAKYFRKI